MKFSTIKSILPHYSVDDFYKIRKIDAHIHVNGYRENLLEQAVKDNFTLISINVDAFPDQSIEQQQVYALNYKSNFPDRFYHLTTFRVTGFDQPGWTESVLAYLARSVEFGAVGVKIWKNIGMEIRDKQGRLVFIDDPVFDPVLNYLELHKIPLAGHIGEPKSCWLPIDQMITSGDRDYFSKNSEFYMYLYPESPSYEMHIERRNRMLEKHPGLRYVGAHLGSQEWNIDELAKALDTYPMMSVDMAERICYFQCQSAKDHKKVYDFFVKYQDRLLYGTDIITNGTGDTTAERKKAHDIWMNDWVYFNTDWRLTSPAISPAYNGLRLPKVVIDKIYRENAQRIYLNNLKENR